MAITLADFTKIWASTSPLTPYSFSDANYQEGWNFVGATPPARQMWDSIQKQNDEKLKYIVDNFLPLAGGTMTGGIVSKDTVLKHSDDTGYIRIDGGSSDSNGATLSLWGDSHTANAGEFRLRANDGNNNKYFIGKPDGTMTWGGSNIVTDTTVHNLLVVETKSSASATISGGSANTYSIDVSKSGYTPIGIVGFSAQGSARSRASFFGINFSASATVRADVYNQSSSSVTWTVDVDILYVKNSI